MKSILATLSAAALFSSVSFAGIAAAASITPEQKTEIEEIIRNYLLENPELLREMSSQLEARERLAEETARTTALSQQSAAIYKGTADPVVGNPKGDVTMVEFFDYNCSWCKKSVKEVVGLIASDKNLKVIMKEFPIFGEASSYAAKAALAAADQGKYWELHQALFAHEGQVTEDVTNQIAEGLGLDMTRLKADIASGKHDAALKANAELAQAMMINGTPAFIIDDQVVPGYMPLDGLVQAIAEVRKSGGCKIC